MIRTFFLLLLVLAGCSSTGTVPIAREPRDLQGLPRETINNTIRAHRKEVQKCYDLALAENPKLQGKVVVAFNIEKAGTAVDPEIRGQGLGSESLHQCLTGAIKSWKFPEATRTTEVRAYPFYFHPEK